MDTPDARLEIPRVADKIIVHFPNKSLPLRSLGTGIEQVIIFATAVTFLTSEIICIEEPENHLHPILQRKLLRYLFDHTDNQYFISTHSAQLLDVPNATVFHVEMIDGQTRVSRAIAAQEKFDICSDLGYRASDILQCNCVIWVEGPSDRIYLNHWIRAIDDSLIEKVHYSIMFYGGRLLNHLTANDEEVDDFISLRRLNRNVIIVMDSDKRSGRTELNATKLRVQKEIEDNGGIAWVTAGRMIENYIEKELLTIAVEAVSPGSAAKVKYGRYSDVVPCVEPRSMTSDKSARAKGRKVDKIKIANEVTKHAPNLSVLKLRERVEEVVAFIRVANSDS